MDLSRFSHRFFTSLRIASDEVSRRLALSLPKREPALMVRLQCGHFTFEGKRSVRTTQHDLACSQYALFATKAGLHAHACIFGAVLVRGGVS